MNAAIYLISLVSLVAIDNIWLFSMMNNYKKWLGPLMGSSPAFLPALFFYPIYALAVTLLVLLPAVKNGGTVSTVFLQGLVLGLAAYGAYDLTNQATLKDWPVIMTLVDMMWGAFLTGLVSAITLMVFRYLQ